MFLRTIYTNHVQVIKHPRYTDHEINKETLSLQFIITDEATLGKVDV